MGRTKQTARKSTAPSPAHRTIPTKYNRKRKDEEEEDEEEDVDESLSEVEDVDVELSGGDGDSGFGGNKKNKKKSNNESSSGGLLNECKELFGTNNLYQVLSLNKTATLIEIKKAYHKLSLKVHPDKVEEKVKADGTLKFQALGKIYTVLSDTEKRRLYDETGEVDGESILSCDSDRDWDSYWRVLFRKITIEDVNEFFKTYKGSNEEREDLKKLYVKHKGEMDLILEEALAESVIDDEPRLREILNDAIEKDEVEKFRKFTHETKAKQDQRRNKYEKEAKEAEKLKKELGIDDSDDITKLIQQRHETRKVMAGKFFDNLEAKYGKKEKASTASSKATAKKRVKKSAAAAVDSGEDDDE